MRSVFCAHPKILFPLSLTQPFHSSTSSRKRLVNPVSTSSSLFFLTSTICNLRGTYSSPLLGPAVKQHKRIQSICLTILQHYERVLDICSGGQKPIASKTKVLLADYCCHWRQLWTLLSCGVPSQSKYYNIQWQP